ncbi:telomerase-binding protein EST1A-like [Watersipora subatra]|uniref:telomerase-binding protein EST1A-like n=1 Tax=Watersipora subatra TaxID=2589382 RepID=UPI00355B2CF9
MLQSHSVEQKRKSNRKQLDKVKEHADGEARKQVHRVTVHPVGVAHKSDTNTAPSLEEAETLNTFAAEGLAENNRSVSRSSEHDKPRSSKANREKKKGRRKDQAMFDPSVTNESAKTNPGRAKLSGGLLKMPPPIDSLAQDDSPGRRTLYDPNQPAPSRTCRRALPNDVDELYQMPPGAPVYPGSAGYYSPAYTDPLVDPAYTVPVVSASPYSYNRSPYHTLEQSLDNEYSSPYQQKLSVIIRDVAPLERQLLSLSSQRLQLSKESTEHINRLRGAVREKLEQVLLLDLDYSIQRNIDQKLWKAVYHQLLENLRDQLRSGTEEGNDSDEIRNQINAILDEADSNYESLLLKLQRSCHFDLSNHTTPQRSLSVNKMVKLALIMSQRILICLGDIARYRTQNTQPLVLDYGRARRYYLQASHVAPKNGRPYNQLAIIALYAKRRLDTVFYYMRSITASNAFLSAKETLHGIYNDIIKKYTATRVEAERRKKARISRQRSSLSTSHKRIEHWYSPVDGSTFTDHVDAEEDIENPRKMPCNEVYKNLMTMFLSCQGMIYSKVGMEKFPETSSQVLYYLDALLSHSPLPLLDLTKLIQMFAIGMFSVYHAGLQGLWLSLDTFTEKCRTYTQEQAVLLLLDMSTIVTQRCTVLLESQSSLSISVLASSDLMQLLPVVKLVTDWMTCHPHLWNPPPCPRDPSLGPVLDPWLSIAKLSNCLTRIQGTSIPFYMNEDVDPDTSSENTWLSLPEELQLRGFLPLMNLSNDDVFIRTDSCTDQDIAAMCHRVQKLITFADYLCGIEPPMLDFDTRDSKYKSLVDPPSLSEKTVQKVTENTQSFDEEDELSSSDISSDSEPDSVGTTSELRKTKHRLRKQLAKQEKQQRLHQAVLDSEMHGVIQLEIRPIFIVPDTNCFIEYPSQMKALITSQKFTVIVPLVVINELDGISNTKPGEENPRFSHPDIVKREAVKAVDFLESEFERRNRRLKAVTVTGTELPSIAFRTEETDQLGSNDDKILSCCLHYCQDNARDFMPKDRHQAIRLYREVVLVTDDRNLRLKAHTRNVPVKDLVQFMEWAGIYCGPVK